MYFVGQWRIGLEVAERLQVILRIGWLGRTRVSLRSPSSSVAVAVSLPVAERLWRAVAFNLHLGSNIQTVQGWIGA